MRKTRVFTIASLLIILVLNACGDLLSSPRLIVNMQGSVGTSALVTVSFSSGGAESFVLSPDESKEISIPLDLSGGFGYVITAKASDETIAKLKAFHDELVLNFFADAPAPNYDPKEALASTQETLDLFQTGASCENYFDPDQDVRVAEIVMYTAIDISC